MVALVTHAGHLSLAPFNPANISGGLTGFGLGFPVAVYLFVGWENSAALAEETDDPRRNVPKAIYASILLMGLSYLLFSYSTIVAFDYNVSALSAAEVPFITAAQKISDIQVLFATAAQKIFGILVLFAYIAGFTSILSSLIAGSNSRSRLIFNAARESLLLGGLAKLDPRRHTPWVSFLVFFGIGLGIVYILTSSPGPPWPSLSSD
ncbi:MAG: APC family permease [Chloroflexota bacterium]|nr:APC family permease [Chloroflexota bacterium]